MMALNRPDQESGEENEEDAMIQHAVSKGGTIYSESEQMKLTGRLIKRVRELTKTIDKQGQATNDLTERIRKLNVWLLVVTIAVGALTFVQVAVALKWIGR
jgi:phage-related protein